MLDAYLDAAETWDIDWALLAAIGKVECDHGRLDTAGCNPPGTQFILDNAVPYVRLGTRWKIGRAVLDESLRCLAESTAAV
jgi:hypothetical protein